MRKKKGNSQNYEYGFGNIGGSGPQDGLGSFGNYGGGGNSGPQDGFGNYGNYGDGGSGPQDGLGSFGNYGDGGNTGPQDGFGNYGNYGGGGNSGPQYGFGNYGGGGNSGPQDGFGSFGGSGYGPADGLQGFGGSPRRSPSIGRIALVILAAAVLVCIAVFAVFTFSGRGSGAPDRASQEGKPAATGKEGDGIKTPGDSGGDDSKPGDDQSIGEDPAEKTAAGQKESVEAQQAAPAAKENPQATAAGKEESQSAAAGKETAQDAESFTDHGYYYDFLNEKEKKAYEGLIQASEKLEGSVTVDLDSEEQAQHVYCAAEFDHPEYYWLQGGYSYHYDDSGKVNLMEFSVPEDAEEMISRLDSTADSVIRQIPEETSDNEYETIKWFYEYLIQTVDYQHASNDQIASSALLDHRSVCAGYSRAFKLLCDKAGIDCIVVFGMCQSPKDKEPDSHVWNMVFIDGTSFWVDVTWGDTFFSDMEPWTDGLICYDYLCSLDKSLLKDHTINYYPCCEDDAEDLYIEYPACTDDRYICYKREGTMFHTVEEGEDYISKSVSTGKKTMVFAFDNEKAYTDMVTELDQGDPFWELITGAGAPYKSMQYLLNEPSMSIFLELR